jgi:tRNA A-37 threonylcarbamoyl transferase component Bud32
MAAAPATTTEFIDLIRKAGIVPESTLDTLTDLPTGPSASAATLISLGHITKFQAKLLLTGRYKGFKLGPYIVKEQIGQGGMGAVYLGEHEALHRKAALKVLTQPKDSKESHLANERFLREARAAAALDHPNIVRLHDIGKQGDMHFLVMEYVEGQTLDRMITNAGPITPSRAVGFIAQAAAGLQHAYEKGFVHRDIKPGNLMLAKDGTVKILDMGLARQSDESDNLTEILDKGAIVGTADYISPEQAMGGDVDTRSDIYSLGATFFALVTGEPPFSGNTTQKLIQHQMKEAPRLSDLDRTFPEDLAEVVATMLAKHPEDRYQTPTELIAALAPWLAPDGGRKVVAGLSGATSKHLQNTIAEVENASQRFGTQTSLAVRQAKQRKVLIWGGGAVAVVLLGALIGYLAAPAKKKDDTQVVANNEPAPKPTPKTPPRTPPKDAKAKSDPKPKDTTTSSSPQAFRKSPANVLVELPVSQMKPFTLHLSHYAGGTNPGLKEEKRGSGSLPPRWYKWIELRESEAEIFAENTADDGPMLGVRITSGGGSFSLNSPSFDAPSQSRVVVTLTYATDEKSEGNAIRFRQMKPKELKSWEAIFLPRTNGVWKTITKEVDLKGALTGLFELTTTGSGPDGTLRFKSFEVTRPAE